MFRIYFYPYGQRVFVMFMAVLLLIGCDDQTKGKKPKDRQQTVAIVKVERHPLTIERSLTGSLEPVSKVHIINETQGRITRLPYHPGDRVKKGDILVQLDDGIIKAELAKATANFKQAKLDLKRIQRLRPRKLASEDEIARAETAVDLAAAEVSLWRTRLGYTRIEAPFDGVISERLIETGDVVSLHSHILTLIDDSALKAKIHVSEYLLTELHEGAPVTVNIDALGEEAFTGKILRVYPAVDPATRLGAAEVLLTPVPPDARAGQLCRVNLGVDTTSLLSLPFAAIKHDSRGDYVFIVDRHGKARYKPITTGLQAGNRIQVIEGLKQGDRVITKGHIGLREGKTVKIAGADQPKADKAKAPAPAVTTKD